MYVNPRTRTLLSCSLLTAAATFSTMVGGVISDIYHAEDRNTPMALFSGAALFGTGLAPMLAGAVVQHTTWRWIWYSHAIVSAVFVVIIFFFFNETRGSVLLSRKAKALNTYYDKLESAGHYGVIMSGKETVKRIRWKVKSDEERASLAQMISISCYRPFRELSINLNIRQNRPNQGIIRLTSDRANRVLLLSVGILQLGSSISPIWLRTAGLRDQPRLQR